VGSTGGVTFYLFIISLFLKFFTKIPVYILFNLCAKGTQCAVLMNIKVNSISCACAKQFEYVFFNNETAAQFTQEIVYMIFFYTHLNIHE